MTTIMKSWLLAAATASCLAVAPAMAASLDSVPPNYVRGVSGPVMAMPLESDNAAAAIQVPLAGAQAQSRYEADRGLMGGGD